MKVYVFGEENEKTLLMFQCTAEPWWVFKNSAEALSKDFRVFLFISDGHDEAGTDFVSIEKNVEQAVSYLHRNGIRYLDMQNNSFKRFFDAQNSFQVFKNYEIGHASGAVDTRRGRS